MFGQGTQRLGHVFLQEFEKMYRVCRLGLIEEMFWVEYEGLIMKTINKQFIRDIWETHQNKNMESQLDGYHPEFKNYLEELYDNAKQPMKHACFAGPIQFVRMTYWG